MNQTAHAWWNFGYAGLFGCVFLEQIGVPIPAFPALLAAGALVASGDLGLPTCIAVAVAAALLADLIWYGVGRAQGVQVLHFICRISWKPDICVSKTKIVFARLGLKTLLFSKFVPGLSLLAAPLSGISQAPLAQFILFDTVGAAAWSFVPLVAGSYLQKSLAALQERAWTMIPYLPWICGTLIIGVLIWRYLDRSRYLKTLYQNLRHGISASELKRRLDAGENVTVLDVRYEVNVQAQPVILPQARWIPYNLLIHRVHELDLAKPLIVYCDCPHDEAAVEIVQLLREKGANVFPLRGGLNAWIEHGFPTETLPLPIAAAP